MAETSKAAELKKKLILSHENSGILMNDNEIKEAMEFSQAYKAFLDKGKTEREVVVNTVKMLREKGFEELTPGKKYKAGDKIYFNNRGQALAFAVIGRKGMDEGTRILASHIDSPRIDLKQRPLYEEAQLAMFKTHYYGGIRKYQWVTIPLALHGVIYNKDGDAIDISIGEADDEPVFCINDLLPHLAQEQSKRKLHEGIKGEELNVLVGTLPFKDDEVSEKVKLNIMNILFEKYGITEHDFLSADLNMVPAFKARDVGFDRSLVGAYGHDDRVCAYTSIMASLDVLTPQYTWINILADKEEVGSDGNTGLRSHFLENFVKDICGDVPAHTVLSRSQCLSADVSAAFDPTFADVNDKKNTAYIGYGASIMKYTGSRGKSSTSEATSGFMNKIRRMFDSEGIIWQTCELGKVDQGGGGTVAMFIAALMVDVIDIGIPVLSMHSPFEIASKLDIYSAYKAFRVFLNDK